MGRMPIPDDQNPSAAADELRCNSQKSTRFAAADDHPLSTMKKKQPPNVSPSRGMAMLLSIISPEATAFGGCAIISPDKFFHPPLPAVVVWFSPPRRCGNIAGYPTHNRKAARTMIGLRGQRCRTRPPMVSLSLSVYWSAPPQVVLCMSHLGSALGARSPAPRTSTSRATGSSANGGPRHKEDTVREVPRFI